MKRNEFIKKGFWGGMLAFLSSSLGNTVQAASKLAISKYRGVEGVV